MKANDQAAPTGVPGPETVTDEMLPNGMRALVRENHASPSVVIDGLLHGGALLEPSDAPGTAGFAVSMLDRGTESRTFEELSDELEAVGAEISFGAGRHTTRFNAKCMAEDLGDVLETLAEMLRAPAFPDAQVDLVRGQIVTALKQRQSNTRHRAAVAFRDLAYGPEHPYGRDTDGTPDSIAGISRDDLLTIYRRALHPSGGVVALVGAASSAAAVEALSGTVGAWQPSGPAPERQVVDPPPRASARRDMRVVVAGKSQSDVVLGNPAIARAHPDWMPAAVANTVLGVFGLMGRLGENVRDKRGLAYYAFSRLSGGLGPGPWYASAGVNPANVDEAIDATLHEMRRLQEELVPEDELADVKAYITGSLPLRLETNGGVAGSLIDIALHDLGLDYLQRFPELVNAVSADDVRRAAQEHLDPVGVAVAVAGPDGAG